jgi:hypothetical protein
VPGLFCASARSATSSNRTEEKMKNFIKKGAKLTGLN